MPQRDVVNDRGWKRAFEYPILLPKMPLELADPTPSQSLEISAYITVYVGDKSCLLNSVRLVSLF
jgi:hypothetical protein